MIQLVAILAHAWAFAWPIASTIASAIALIWGFAQAWPFMRRTFQVTDIVAKLPEQLAELKAGDERKLTAIAELKSTLDKHIEDSKGARAEWGEMRGGLKTLLVNQEKVIYEVQHNGGGSIKDDIAVIKSVVTSGATGELPVPRTTTTNTTSTSTTTGGSP